MTTINRDLDRIIVQDTIRRIVDVGSPRVELVAGIRSVNGITDPDVSLLLASLLDVPAPQAGSRALQSNVANDGFEWVVPGVGSVTSNDLTDFETSAGAASHVFTYDAGDSLYKNRLLALADLDGVTAPPSGTKILQSIEGVLGWIDTPSGGGGGASDWGDLGGTLSDQGDLQAALDAKLALAGGTMTGALAMGANPITTSSTVDGRDLSVDGAKLDLIEANATADQTAAQIKAAYEGELKAFTDAQFDKLAAIEASATADQTGAEIKALYEAEVNAFTDAQFTKLGAIEANATADQTGSEIKSAYEGEADTNAFTDALLGKLNGIATGANLYAHPNHTGDVTSTGDGATVIAASAVTNAKLANEAAWNLLGNATGSAAAPAGFKISALTEEASPASADWILGEDAAGNLRKYDVGNLPTGGGGEVNSGASLGGGIDIYSGKPALDLQFHSLAGESGVVGVAEATDLITISLTAAGVSNAKLANMGSATIKGQTDGGSGAPVDLTAAQVWAILDGSTNVLPAAALSDLTQAALLGAAAAGGVVEMDQAAVRTLIGAGATNGLDSDLLDGQHGAYYQSLDNATGTLSNSRLAASSVSLDKLADMAANGFVGTDGGAGSVETMTVAEAWALLVGDAGSTVGSLNGVTITSLAAGDGLVRNSLNTAWINQPAVPTNLSAIAEWDLLIADSNGDMVNQGVADLTALGTTAANDDLLFLWDTSASALKSVRADNLPGGGGGGYSDPLSTQGEVLYRGASSTDALTPGTATHVLKTGGAAANPSWAQVAFSELSGSLANSQVPTDTVCHDKLVDMTAAGLLGRAAAGAVQELDATAALGILGVEAGATADQTGAEIKTAYEAEANAFTDAQFTKLSNIETAATADQTGAEIKALYEAEASAFTDALFTKLSNIETAATADQTGAEIKALYEAEANAFTDAQFTKLSNIETAATADQTGSEIKALYEVEANAFTDALFTKLSNIETAATADQTAADIRGLGFFDTTNDGTGSGLDADLLDGVHASGFATSGHAHAFSEMTGTLAAPDFADNTIALGRLANMTINGFLGRNAGAPGAVEEMTVAEVKLLLGYDLGGMSDVKSTLAPGDGDVLGYVLGNNRWEAVEAAQFDLTGSPYAIGTVLVGTGTEFTPLNTATHASVLMRDTADTTDGFNFVQLATGHIISGTFLDDRISESSVTQHALAVQEDGAVRGTNANVPGSPDDGQVYYSTDDQQEYYWDNTASEWLATGEMRYITYGKGSASANNFLRIADMNPNSGTEGIWLRRDYTLKEISFTTSTSPAAGDDIEVLRDSTVIHTHTPGATNKQTFEDDINVDVDFGRTLKFRMKSGNTLLADVTVTAGLRRRMV